MQYWLGAVRNQSLDTLVDYPSSCFPARMHTGSGSTSQFKVPVTLCLWMFSRQTSSAARCVPFLSGFRSLPLERDLTLPQTRKRALQSLVHITSGVVLPLQGLHGAAALAQGASSCTGINSSEALKWSGLMLAAMLHLLA
jgi:hypothetical protein